MLLWLVISAFSECLCTLIVLVLTSMHLLCVMQVVGEWSLATDNCAMWLNGFNDNVPGYPKVKCERVKCPDPYMGPEQPGQCDMVKKYYHARILYCIKRRMSYHFLVESLCQDVVHICFLLSRYFSDLFMSLMISSDLHNSNEKSSSPIHVFSLTFVFCHYIIS